MFLEVLLAVNVVGKRSQEDLILTETPQSESDKLKLEVGPALVGGCNSLLIYCTPTIVFQFIAYYF